MPTRYVCISNHAANIGAWSIIIILCMSVSTVKKRPHVVPNTGGHCTVKVNQFWDPTEVASGYRGSLGQV